MNYYELLEVDSNASMEVIKNAYKTLAKKFHPDTYAGDRTFAEEKMKLLNEAISVLENEERRRNYNIENNIGIRQGYRTVFGSPDLTNTERKLTFMDEIDDFINDQKSDKPNKPSKPEKSVKTAKADNRKTIVIDDVEDIEYISNYHNNKKNNSDMSAINEYDDVDNDDEWDDIENFNKGSTKNKPRVGRWYYITVAAFIIINILLVILIVRSIDFANIKNLISSRNAPASDIFDTDEIGEDDFEGDYSGENNGDDYDYMMAVEPSIDIGIENSNQNENDENETGINGDIPQAVNSTAGNVPSQNNIQSATNPPPVQAVVAPPTTNKTLSPTNPPVATKAPAPTNPPTPTKAPTPTNPPTPTKAPTPTSPPTPTKAPTPTSPPTPTNIPQPNPIQTETQPVSNTDTYPTQDDTYITDTISIADITDDIDDAINEPENIEQPIQETTEAYIEPPSAKDKPEQSEQPIQETNAQNIDIVQPETAAPEEQVPDFIEPETNADNNTADVIINEDIADEQVEDMN